MSRRPGLGASNDSKVGAAEKTGTVTMQKLASVRIDSKLEPRVSYL